MPDSSPFARWLHDFIHGADFLSRYPLYVCALSRFEVLEDEGVPSMAVSALAGGRIRLHVNPTYFAEHPQYLRGILLHEVHHVVLGHLTPRFRGRAWPKLMEIAMEVSANEDIREQLPDPVTWQQFSALGLRPNQSTQQRYELLVEHRDQLPPLSVPFGQLVDDHRPSSGQGVAEPRDAGVLADAALLTGTSALIQRLVREAGDFDAHLEGAMLAGRTPGQLQQELQLGQQAPQAEVDWKAALAFFVPRSRTSTLSWSRPSRRQPARIGEVPGRQRRPGQGAKPHLLVAIDTSGSMRQTELAEIAAQLRRVNRHARITVVECDHSIQRTYPFQGSIQTVMGRGGTDLRPPFSPEVLAEHRPDGIVFFTDGGGPHPEDAPGVKTHWVLTTDLERFPCPWGRKVCLRVARAGRGRAWNRAERKRKLGPITAP
jgi:predicted metal-dependent peptidase